MKRCRLPLFLLICLPAVGCSDSNSEVSKDGFVFKEFLAIAQKIEDELTVIDESTDAVEELRGCSCAVTAEAFDSPPTAKLQFHFLHRWQSPSGKRIDGIRYNSSFARENGKWVLIGITRANKNGSEATTSLDSVVPDFNARIRAAIDNALE